MCENPGGHGPPLPSLADAYVTAMKIGTYNYIRLVNARMCDGRTRERDITKIALIRSVDDDEDNFITTAFIV